MNETSTVSTVKLFLRKKERVSIFNEFSRNNEATLLDGDRLNRKKKREKEKEKAVDKRIPIKVCAQVRTRVHTCGQIMLETAALLDAIMIKLFCPRIRYTVGSLTNAYIRIRIYVRVYIIKGSVTFGGIDMVGRKLFVSSFARTTRARIPSLPTANNSNKNTRARVLCTPSSYLETNRLGGNSHQQPGFVGQI